MLIRNLDQTKVNPQRTQLGKAHGKNGFKNSLFRKSNKMSKWVSFFREYHAKKQCRTFKNCQTRLCRNARFGFRRFLDNLEKSTSKHTHTHIGHASSIRLVVTGRVTHYPTWNREKSARQHVWETQNATRPAEHKPGGAYLAKVEINTNTKASPKVKPIYGNQGKAGRFRRKNGEIRHIHVWRKEKIERGKFRTPENNTVRLETRTQGQFDNAVCTNTIALRLPLILIRKVFRHTHTQIKQKVSSKAYITTRPAKHVRSEKKSREQKQQKLSRHAKAATIAATDALVVLTFSLRRRPSTPRNGKGGFPPSESSQRSIKNKANFYYFKGWSTFCWFLLPAKQTDHSHLIIHTQVHRETNLKRMHRSNFRSILR